MSEQSRTIEINGIKFEVDERTATLKKIDTIAIGAKVKVLKKEYGDSFKVHHGVVVGFEPFNQNPCVIIAYVEDSYSSADVKFLYYTDKSPEQIVISDEADQEALIASNVIDAMDRKIIKLQNEIQEIEDKKTYFKNHFKVYWKTLIAPSGKKDEAVVN